MKKGKILILIILLMSLFNLSATEENKDKENNQIEFTKGLGFTAGNISGTGFAFRQYFDKSGIQFTFGLLTNADKVPKFPDENYNDVVTKTGWDVDGWASLMYLRTLRESTRTKFYYFIGGSINIDYSKKYSQHYVYSSSVGHMVKAGSLVKDGRNNNSYYFGPGIGLDLKLSKYVSLLIELPISISSYKEVKSYIPQGGILVKF